MSQKQYTRKSRGRPPKNKTNSIDSDNKINNNIILNNDKITLNNDKNIIDPLLQYEEEYIRPPDETKKERLIYYDEEDEEMMKAINLSRMEFYKNMDAFENTHIFKNYNELPIEDDFHSSLIDNNYENPNNDYNIHDTTINHYNDTTINEMDDVINEDILNESKNIEIEKRMNSLSNFMKMIKKINPIYFTEKENQLQTYIEEKMNDYFNLNVDKIIIEDIQLYNDLFSMIDTYYVIPKNKNYKKFIIPYEEDQLLRQIFVNNFCK